MQISSVIRLCGILGFVALVGAGPVDDETSLDPIIVAPEEFKVALENEHVRVVRVMVVDGTVPARHSHPHRVVVFVSDCTWLEEAEDGSIIEEKFSKGDVSWQESMIHESYPNHVKDSCELLEIELK